MAQGPARVQGQVVIMQASSNRITTIEQLYATAGAMSAPVLIHVDGAVEWGNPSFIHRFGVNEDAMVGVRVREMLWCLGFHEAVAGMIGENIPFSRCVMPAHNPNDPDLYLKQVCLTMQPDGRRRMMLVLADEFDPDPQEFEIGDN